MSELYRRKPRLRETQAQSRKIQGFPFGPFRKRVRFVRFELPFRRFGRPGIAKFGSETPSGIVFSGSRGRTYVEKSRRNGKLPRYVQLRRFIGRTHQGSLRLRYRSRHRRGDRLNGGPGTGSRTRIRPVVLKRETPPSRRRDFRRAEQFVRRFVIQRTRGDEKRERHAMIVFPVSHRRRQRVFRRNGRLPPICQRSRAATEERFRIHYRNLVQRRFHDEGDDPYRISGMRPLQRMGARMVKDYGQPTGILRRRQLARHREFGHDQRLAPRSGFQLLRNRQALSRRNAARGRRGDFDERRQHDHADYRLKAV